MAANPFDQFDTSATIASNPFDQFDAPKGRANVAAEATPPDWAKTYPSAYKGLVKARQVAGPTIEAAGGIAGGIIGAGAGA